MNNASLLMKDDNDYLNNVMKNDTIINYTVGDLPLVFRRLLYSFMCYYIVKICMSIFVDVNTNYEGVAYIAGIHALQQMYSMKTRYDIPFELHVSLSESNVNMVVLKNVCISSFAEYMKDVPIYMKTVMLKSNIIKNADKCSFHSKDAGVNVVNIYFKAEGKYGYVETLLCTVYIDEIKPAYDAIPNLYGNPSLSPTNHSSRAFTPYCNLYQYYDYLKNSHKKTPYQTECLDYLENNFGNYILYTSNGLAALKNKPTSANYDLSKLSENIKEYLKKEQKEQNDSTFNVFLKKIVDVFVEKDEFDILIGMVENNIQNFYKIAQTKLSSRIYNGRKNDNENCSLSIYDNVEAKKKILDALIEHIKIQDMYGVIQFYTYISDNPINTFLKEVHSKSVKNGGVMHYKTLMDKVKKNCYRVLSSYWKINKELKTVEPAYENIYIDQMCENVRWTLDEYIYIHCIAHHNTNYANVIKTKNPRAAIGAEEKIDNNCVGLTICYYQINVENRMPNIWYPKQIPDNMALVCKDFENEFENVNKTMKDLEIFKKEISGEFYVYRCTNLMPMFTENGILFDPNFVNPKDEIFMNFPSYLSCSHSSDFSLDVFLRKYAFVMKIKINKNSNNWVLIDKYSYFHDSNENEVLLKAGSILKLVNKHIGVVTSRTASIDCEKNTDNNSVDMCNYSEPFITTEEKKSEVPVLEFILLDSVNDIILNNTSSQKGGSHSNTISCINMNNDMINTIKNNNKNAIIHNFTEQLFSENFLNYKTYKNLTK